MVKVVNPSVNRNPGDTSLFLSGCFFLEVIQKAQVNNGGKRNNKKLLTNFNIGPSACPSSVRATRDDSRIVFFSSAFYGDEIDFKGISSCTKHKAEEIIKLPVFMTERYFVTNPVCSMMIKMSV
jgi:hypothetical protein